ncbi:Beta-porphyranase B precursor [Planctomycetes bacterium CA13]|uniref:Beta-porphyranase B n=1 Tax=Novipirellula herctigrandis TaxID=2527986 RepID=A0A5C5YZ73_9BACT|nr:Beta-porphyranase B precursor [Planctomycetes bacterium CA13]
MIKKTIWMLTACLLQASVTTDAWAQNAKQVQYRSAIEHMTNLPEPPEGFKWAVNPDFTDEFEGGTLNAEKWYDKSPYWTNGRSPATFKAYNVSVENGCLRIKNSRLDPPEGNDGEPGDKYHLAGGAVASKSDQAWYGYYETRMKASPTPMSSTFWLKNLPKRIRYVDETGKLVIEEHRQELDILETMGKPTRHPDWGRQFNSNTHYGLNVEEGRQRVPNLSVSGPKDDHIAIEDTAKDFHTYGLWWVDPNTLHFYYEGEFRFTINPGTMYNRLPFARPMYMHLVTETYSWEPSLPTDEMLTDDPKNSTHYDWVRSYVLVRK